MMFSDDHFETALFTDLGVNGVRGTSAVFETTIAALLRAIDQLAPTDAERLRFPPVMSRRQIVAAGYDRSFPNLLGSVYALASDDASAPTATDLVLTPACCYPVYPHVAGAGAPPPQGRLFDVSCDCFRCEPSRSPVRLQSFRMREFVYVGAPEDAVAFRDARQADAARLFADLGLAAKAAPANDPFFGKGASFLKARQRADGLKVELVIDIVQDGPPTACASFNCHQSHFGDVWDIRLESGEVAHSACAAFGLDRLATALFARHGVDPKVWPDGVRCALDL
jgi:seryl-tRNA synthetase